MSYLQQYVRQVRPRNESYIPPVEKIQNFLSEDIDLPKDVLDGFEYTQTDKSTKSRVQIKVVSDDRDNDRDEILRRLGNAGITANTFSTTTTSVDPIDGNFEGRNFRISVKPKSGGMGESTLNSSITELFPCIAFEKKLNPTSIEDFMVKLMAVDLKSCKCIFSGDMDAAERTVNDAEGSSKYEVKMDAALAFLKFLNDQHNDKAIKNVYWGYRSSSKPAGVPKGHPGDMFIEYTGPKPNLLGVSLKAGGKKTKEPQLNTYHNTMFVNSKGPDFGDKAGMEALRKLVYAQVYSKIKGMPPIDAYNTRKGKKKTDAAINKLSKKDQDSYYDQYLGLVRQALVDRFNKDKKASLKYIKDAILREAPDVPTIVIKAVKSSYEEVTDRDAVGVFLPQVEFVKAYLSSSGKSKQNWFIALLSGDEIITLSMAVRSSTGGKLKQHNLKVTYNGLK